jgi:hypothetical protein
VKIGLQVSAALVGGSCQVGAWGRPVTRNVPDRLAACPSNDMSLVLPAPAWQAFFGLISSLSGRRAVTYHRIAAGASLQVPPFQDHRCPEEITLWQRCSWPTKLAICSLRRLSALRSSIWEALLWPIMPPYCGGHDDHGRCVAGAAARLAGRESGLVTAANVARRSPETTALVHGETAGPGENLTSECPRSLPAWLSAAINPETASCLTDPNHPEYVQVMFAAWRIGAVLAPVKTRLDDRSLAKRSRQCDDRCSWSRTRQPSRMRRP